MFSVTEILERVLRNEGGLSDHPRDRGGYTKFGITLYTLALWRENPVTQVDLEALTKEEALEIYREWYYVRAGLFSLPEKIQGQMLDIAVNCGQSRAVKILQRTLNEFKLGRIEEDGKLGPITKGKARQCFHLWGCFLGDALVDQRIHYYVDLVKAVPDNLVFLKGWINRALTFKSYYMED